VTVYAFKDGLNNSDRAIADILIASEKDGDVILQYIREVAVLLCGAVVPDGCEST
jgi:hypothetical protein